MTSRTRASRSARRSRVPRTRSASRSPAITVRPRRRSARTSRATSSGSAAKRKRKARKRAAKSSTPRRRRRTTRPSPPLPKSPSPSRPTTTTRTRLTNSGLTRVALAIFLLAGSACEALPKIVPSGDVRDASQVARATASVLLQLSAYDYALAGALAGEKSRVVTNGRWAAVARGLLPKIGDITSASLSATANAAGPVRNAVVSLADSLTDLAKDAGSYADGGEPGVFAKTVGDVASSWDRVGALAAQLPADPELEKTVARGRSFTVSTKSDPAFALQAGPYSTAADADGAAKKIGTVISVTRTPPFVVRVATYGSKAQADAAAAALRPKGIDVTAVVEEKTYAFTRGGTVPDTELWREPTRVIDGPGGARRVALSPDGAALGDPFPLTTPGTGGFIAVDDRGELFIATTTAGGTDVELLRLGVDRSTRDVVRVPGAAVAFALDAKGDRAAVVTDQGTFRFSPHAADPKATLQKAGVAVRDVSFGADGTLYQLDKDKASAIGPDGASRWQARLIDGRKLVVGTRTVVWDGTDTVIAAAPSLAHVTAALEAVGDSTLTGAPHRVTMRDLYASHCATCRGPVVVEAFLWERDAPAPTKKAFRCAICAREGRALLIEPTAEEDDARARKVEGDGLAYWQFVERFGATEERRVLAQSIAALYTPRNLAALMRSLRAIETALPDGAVKAFLRLCLLEVIVSGSRLNAVAGHGAPLRIEKGRARRGQASQSREVNVWLEFERTARQLASWLTANPPARSVATLKAAADLVLVQAPVEDPLGGWAYVASVVLAGEQGDPSADGDGRLAGRERLLRTLRTALLDAHRGSKDGAPCVVYVPHADGPLVAACALAGAGSGYRLRGILYQRDTLPTATGGSSGAVAVLDFERDAPLLKDQRPADSLTLEETMRMGVHAAIVARGEPVTGDRAAVAALNALADRRLLAPLALARAGGISELELFLDHFRSALGDGRRSGLERLDGADPETPLYGLSNGSDDHAPLDDRVEWGVWGVLSSAHDVDTRSLLKRSYGLFRGAETPDRELVERCIAAYGLQGDDGRWRIREEDALAKRQLEQTLLAASLIDAGHRIGFKVQVGRELRRRPLGGGYAGKANVLADLLTDVEKTTPLARAVRGPADVLDAVDLAWYDRGK